MPQRRPAGRHHRRRLPGSVRGAARLHRASTDAVVLAAAPRRCARRRRPAPRPRPSRRRATIGDRPGRRLPGRNPAVRGLLVDYLHERQAGLDYSSLRSSASKLVLLFWRDLELHEPGIDSLHLPDDVARRWKERLRVVTHGKHRVGRRREDPNTILLAVRAFYADINHWATQDPARWGRWAAPNPISARDLIGQNKQKHRATGPHAPTHPRARPAHPRAGRVRRPATPPRHRPTHRRPSRRPRRRVHRQRRNPRAGRPAR